MTAALPLMKIIVGNHFPCYICTICNNIPTTSYGLQT